MPGVEKLNFVAKHSWHPGCVRTLIFSDFMEFISSLLLGLSSPLAAVPRSCFLTCGAEWGVIAQAHD